MVVLHHFELMYKYHHSSMIALLSSLSSILACLGYLR
jgi:hypothetical protein